jgi:hypothetical protein
MQEKERNNSPHWWACKDFFTHICEKKMTFHNCEPTSEFFDSHMRGKNDIAHLQAHKWFLFIHIDEEKKDIAHL